MVDEISQIVRIAFVDVENNISYQPYIEILPIIFYIVCTLYVLLKIIYNQSSSFYGLMLFNR